MRRELGLGVNAFLRLSGMSKGTYYRRRRQAQAGRSSSPSRPRPKREAIRGPAREIALAFPTYGYRKVWAGLLRQGIQTSQGTVYRVLKKDCCFRQSGRLRTKDPSCPSPSR